MVGRSIAIVNNRKPLIGGLYKGFRETIAKKVNDSESKWDDVAFNMVDKLVSQFLDLDLSKEKSAAVLIDEKKAA